MWKFVFNKIKISFKSFKEQGNELYKMSDFRAAAGKYHRAILYLKGIDTDLHGTPAYLQFASVDPQQKNCVSKEVEQECIQLNISVHNNLCACLMQQDTSNPERVKHLAEVVIELEDKNEKAWFRRGQACLKLKDFDTALDCFNKVCELSGGSNKEGVRLQRETELNLEAQRQKERKIYQDMFRPRSEA